MTPPRIEEMVEDLLPTNFIEYDPGVDDEVVNIKKLKQTLTKALTEAHQAGIDEVVEKIICSAVRFKGKVWMGHRHMHALDAMHGELSYTMNRKEMNEQQTDRDQGFITSTGRYVGREEAWDIAERAGQLNERKNKTLGYLYSEDLW